MKYRKCTCGADIPEDKIYCEKCGRAIQIVPDYDPEEDFTLGQEEAEELETLEADRKSYVPLSRWKYVIAGICLLVFGCLIYQYAYHATRQSDEIPAESDEVSGLEELLERPQFSIESGTYSYSPILTLSHVERDKGQIYYTRDGTTPGEESILYNAPIPIEEGMTVIRAVFIRSDGAFSEEAVGTYHVEFSYPDEPVFSVPSGDYTGGFSVTMTSGEDCRIYYTTNGEEPGIRSRLYQGPVYIPPGFTVLQAVAVDEDGGMSGIVEAIYNVSENPEVPVGETGEISSEEQVIP